MPFKTLTHWTVGHLYNTAIVKHASKLMV
jgi:hypothetical protein